MQRPVIKIAKSDLQSLWAVATNAMSSPRPQQGASMLLAELGRAVVLTEQTVPSDIVTMRHRVNIFDNVAGKSRWLRVVYPDDEHDAEAISVLTPLGAALLGMTEGDSIEWCTAFGDRRSVTVRQVERPSERTP